MSQEATDQNAATLAHFRQQNFKQLETHSVSDVSLKTEAHAAPQLPELAPIAVAFQLPSGALACHHVCVSTTSTNADVWTLCNAIAHEHHPEPAPQEQRALALDALTQFAAFLAPWGLKAAPDRTLSPALQPPIAVNLDHTGHDEHTHTSTGPPRPAPASWAARKPVRPVGTVVTVRVAVYNAAVLYNDVCGWALGDAEPSPETYAKLLVAERGWPASSAPQVAWHIRKQLWQALWGPLFPADPATLRSLGLEAPADLPKQLAAATRSDSFAFPTPDEERVLQLYSKETGASEDTAFEDVLPAWVKTPEKGTCDAVSVVSLYESSPVIRSRDAWSLVEPLAVVELSDDIRVAAAAAVRAAGALASQPRGSPALRSLSQPVPQAQQQQEQAATARAPEDTGAVPAAATVAPQPLAQPRPGSAVHPSSLAGIAAASAAGPSTQAYAQGATAAVKHDAMDVVRGRLAQHGASGLPTTHAQDAAVPMGGAPGPDVRLAQQEQAVRSQASLQLPSSLTDAQAALLKAVGLSIGGPPASSSRPANLASGHAAGAAVARLGSLHMQPPVKRAKPDR